MSREGALWIGGLEPYMDEEFIRNSLALMGEDSIVSIKVIKNKFTGEPASYGFINFTSDANALMAMHKLNGKIIPNSTPPVRYQLNHASAKFSGTEYSSREFSIWISDLTENVTDKELRKTFATRFESFKSSKIVEDTSVACHKKYFGFVRFTDQNDQRDALIHMNGFRGLGDNPIKVTLAIPKHKMIEKDSTEDSQYSYMYESYWADRGAWGNYGSYHGNNKNNKTPLLSNNSKVTTDNYAALDFLDEDDATEDRIIEHNLPVNVDSMNTEFINRSNEVWDGIERDRWLYNLDNEEGIIPVFRQMATKSKENNN